MICLPATSFGYGLRVGITCVMEERASFVAQNDMRGCALTFPFLPSVALFNAVARTSGIEFCVIPLCSSYSHLAATIWSSAVPAMAIQEPRHLPDAVCVLADFDKGLLQVAESESEGEWLRMRALQSTAVRQTCASVLRGSSIFRSGFAVLAEATSARDFLGALADGADGLSVVKAEHLFDEIGKSRVGTEALIRAVKANPQVLPLPVRFFDPDQEYGDHHGRSCVPQKYLGYRGVRILEIDDTWFQRFVAGLAMLDLEEIVVVLPMVTSVSEVRRIRERIGQKWDKLGVTVETPAAALRIKEILEVSDFIQIGLNDLTQYTMAWDRDVPNQERLPSDRIVEPVEDLIAAVAAACTAARIPYTLGMDLRPSESLVAQVLQLGVASISCAPSLIKPWKDAISNCFGQPFSTQ